MSKISEEVEKAFKEYKKETVFPYVEKKVLYTAELLIRKAVYYRNSAPEKHNFTGNLLASIVACVYKEGKPLRAFYASDKVIGVIDYKMSAPKKYTFKEDYEGTSSTYTPDIVTNKGLGEDDARSFFEEYRPEYNDPYCIVLAYTTEYADWVENKRRTTGFAYVYTDMEKNGWKFLQLYRTYRRPADFSNVPF